MGEKNFLHIKKIPPLRGNIIDSNGYLLASNKPIYDLYWIGTGERQLTKKQKNILVNIGEILKQDFFVKDKINSIDYINKNSKQILLGSNLGFKKLCVLSEKCFEVENLKIESRFQRVYPYKNLAGHILGYLSKEIEDYTTKGLSGLEKMFQEQLKGKTGHVLNVINSRGRKIDQVEFAKPKQGNDLKLTLDFNLQYLAEKAFEEDSSGLDLSGALILMDPYNGSIKSLVSYPEFDPNDFLKPISQKDWNEKFIKKNVFLNRAINASYPPASIFKLITFAAGLEEGVIGFDEKFNCKGFINFHGRRYHCIRHWGHGSLDCKNSLAYSCNIPCYEIAQKLKINEIADYAFRFGLGRKTGFLLSENSGFIPTYEWKVATLGERWWKGDTLSVAIGQGYTLATPLQIIRMIASISTGYLVKPRILDQEDVEKEKLEISNKTLNFLQKAMREVVKKGSAKNLRNLKDIKVYAKTGTAQTTSLTVEKKKKEYLEHAWLASYFKYKNEDPLALVIFIEHVGTSAPARQLAARFLQDYRNYKEKII